MRFIIKEGNYEHKENILIYYQDEYSFDVKPRTAGAVTSVLINDLELMINMDGEVLFVCGLCPYVKWKKTNERLTSYNPAGLYVDLGKEIIPGVSTRINKEKQWDVFINENTGWICVGDPKSKARAIEFAANSIAIIDSEELKALWLKPEKLPIV